MTEIIIGERGSGKTTELIKISAETGAYIVEGNKHQAELVKTQARKMGYDNIRVLYISQFMAHDMPLYKPDILEKGVLLDEVQDMYMLLHYLRNVPIKAVTITDHDGDISIRRLEKPQIDILKFNESIETLKNWSNNIKHCNEAIETLKNWCNSVKHCNDECPFLEGAYDTVHCRLHNPPYKWEV